MTIVNFTELDHFTEFERYSCNICYGVGMPAEDAGHQGPKP